jgi:hypothetical protein
MPSTGATDTFLGLKHAFPPLRLFEGAEGHQRRLTILTQCSLPSLISAGHQWRLEGVVVAGMFIR